MKNSFIAAWIILFQFSFAQYGVFDSSFNNGFGHNRTVFGGDSKAESILFQNNGKIIFAGNSNEGTTYGNAYVGLVRLNNDGTFDSTFGNNGTMRLSVNNQSFSYFSSIKNIDDHSYYLVTSYGSYRLTKLNEDCIVDTTFGNNGTINFNYGYSFSNVSINVNSNGSFRAVGMAKQTSTSAAGVLIGNYNNDGTVNTSYGNNGFVFLPLDDIPSTNYSGFPIFLNDGKILVLGNYVFTDNDSVQKRNFFLKKFNTDGTVDTTYGNNGKILSNVISSAYYYELESDDTVSVLGNPSLTYLNSQRRTIKPVKFDNNGNLINAPIVYSSIPLLNASIYNVIKQQDGKVLSSGSWMSEVPVDQSDSYICRFMPDGTNDPTFGDNGKFTAAFGGIDYIIKIAFDPDGKLVFAGTTIYNGHYEYIMGRLLTGVTLGIIDFSEPNDFNFYPNPSNGIITIDYKLAEETKLSLSLYDYGGKKVKDIFMNELRKSGTNKEEIDITPFQKGIYLLIFSDENSNKIVKKIIIR
jgi:uncharacterized delta-60 repeat protein